MENAIPIVVAMAILALVIVAAFFFFRRRGKASLKGPWGLGLTVEGANDPSPGVRVEDARSRSGGLAADDKTGRGAHVSHVETEKDIKVTSNSPGGADDPNH